MTKAFRIASASVAGCLALNAAAAEPTISDVRVHQRWPWSRLVDIDYVLTCDDSNRVDITVAAYNSATPLTLPKASLSGDVDSVLPGTRRIVWDPSKTAYTNELLTQFRITLTPALAPAYMIINLAKAKGEDGQVTYLYDWSNVWYDVTNHVEYMTTNLVLRRIPAGTFMEGSPTSEPNHGANEDRRQVTLTAGFYIGVFEVTQTQWALLMDNAWPSYFTNELCKATRPVERITYSATRGTTRAMGVMDTSSFMGRLNAKTGLTVDLPTEAQWEYACRAGTTGRFNNGIASPDLATQKLYVRGNENGGGYNYNDTGTNGIDRAVDDTKATARVGSYLPNAWGLYDMHGNVWERTLDNHLINWGSNSATDPVYFNASSDTFTIRGDCFDQSVFLARSAIRVQQGGRTTGASANQGFRVWVAIP
jgi:formylglycine-generating enzyme required for sulfatase activity